MIIRPDYRETGKLCPETCGYSLQSINFTCGQKTQKQLQVNKTFEQIKYLINIK